MKKISLFLFSLFLGLNAMAEDILQVVPFSTQAGIVENEWEYSFSINMTNTHVYSALQFDIYLPEGMTLIEDGPFDFNSDRFPGKVIKKVWYPNHDIDITNPGPGHYFVKVYNVALEPIGGTEGEMFSVYYLTSPDMKPGIYPIRVEGTVLGIDGNHGIYPETSVSYVKIGEPDDKVVDLGNYYVPSFVQEKLADEKNIIAGGVCKKLVLNDGIDFVVENPFTAEVVNYDAAVSASLGYKTLVLPYNCALPSGFEAYEVGSVTDNTLNMVQVQTITANKPVILKNAGTALLSAMNVTVNATNGAALENGILEGTYTEIPAPVGSYVLQNIGGNIAFYPVAAGKQPMVGAFRAYLTAGVSSAKALQISFDETETGVEAVNADVDVMQYNINGQRISDNAKGLRIVRTANGVSKRVK